MNTSVGALFDACAWGAALGPRWRHGKPVLWLDSAYVQVGHRTWRPRQARPAPDGSGTVFGYDARQCAQIAAALLPVMAAHQELTERYASGAAAVPPQAGEGASGPGTWAAPG